MRKTYSFPAQPLAARIIEAVATNLVGLVVSGDYAYCAAWEDGLRISNHNGISVQAAACDMHGNCTTKTSSVGSGDGAAPYISILGPDLLLDSLEPAPVTGQAAGVDGLHSLVATVDGIPIYSQNWASGARTETLGPTNWMCGGLRR